MSPRRWRDGGEGVERPSNVLNYKRLRRLPLSAKSPFLMAGWRAAAPVVRSQKSGVRSQGSGAYWSGPPHHKNP
jgi:hypothetical protein